MEEMPHDSPLSESGSSDHSWWPSDFVENLNSVSLVSQEENSGTINSSFSARHIEISPHAASQVLWETGCFSARIPNGFYTGIPDKKLKELFATIPSPDDIFSLGVLGHRAEFILVDAEKDRKLSNVKKLSAVTLVKCQNSSPSHVIKKIAKLVCDFFKRRSSEHSPAKANLQENYTFTENSGIQLLGQIKNGSCRPRALLFKVLADAAGLENKLMVGLPSDGDFDMIDSYKHLSVVVMLNSTELFVDLTRFPGRLIPFSTKSFFISHISTAGESDSAENDSCDSPIEPNSPLHSFPDTPDGRGQVMEENFQPMNQQRPSDRGVSQNIAGPSKRSSGHPSVFSERRMSSSHSESNIANAVWRRSRNKVVAEQRTASSSPEHPLFRARQSMLSGDKHSIGKYADGVSTSRSDGARMSDIRRPRLRSKSIAPEIGDDIARAVRAMNETLKKNSLLKNDGEEISGPCLTAGKNQCYNQTKDASNYHSGDQDELSHVYLRSRNHLDSTQKAVSLPSSPHDFEIETSNRSGSSILTWNKVLQSSSFINKPLLPFHEWNIEYSELTVGTRVGIGFFGEVFRGIWNGSDVAIKVFLEQDMTAENMEDFCNEVYILSRLRHPNVILFLGACMKPPHLSMVTEYMEMGSLYYLIHMSGEKKRLNWRRRFKMLRDICRGLMCIHRMKIVHRDIKSANCLVNKHWTVKICDFGLSREISDLPMRDNSSAGTPEWMAPELIRQEPFTEKCDIFSLGVIMWELCTLKRPWEGIPPVQVIFAVANDGSRLEVPDGPLGKLILDCWSEPEERPTCKEILSRLLDCEYSLC